MDMDMDTCTHTKLNLKSDDKDTQACVWIAPKNKGQK